MSGKPERWIVIPGWEKFQHYRHDRPPWIKEWVDQLRRDEYMDLSHAGRGVPTVLRLAFAEQNGVLTEARAKHMLSGGRTDPNLGRHFVALAAAGFIELVDSPPPKLRATDGGTNEGTNAPPNAGTNAGTNAHTSDGSTIRAEADSEDTQVSPRVQSSEI